MSRGIKGATPDWAALKAPAKIRTRAKEMLRRRGKPLQTFELDLPAVRELAVIFESQVFLEEKGYVIVVEEIKFVNGESTLFDCGWPISQRFNLPFQYIPRLTPGERWTPQTLVPSGPPIAKLRLAILNWDSVDGSRTHFVEVRHLEARTETPIGKHYEYERIWN